MGTIGARSTIGVLSRETGVNVETIRYYERIGLLPEPARTEGGHRLYNEDQLRRLVFIRRGRELGFSLEDLKTLIDLVDGGYTCGEVRDITLAHLDDIRRKIVDLRRLEKTLKTTAAQCAGGIIPECPVIDTLFKPFCEK
ncbi:MAG: helix-turn-helix domain-containing protein [Pseudomonadota bacterium]|nr:helix-turn-helix domain-containing protein [Pseudomonadota bacterium]